MNVFDYVNSKDVKEYWRKINLKFTLPEACFIIWRCDGISYEQKCAAWLQAAETMPDCAVQKRCNCPQTDSFATFLKANIGAGNRQAIEEVFEGLWFYFPMPFKKGDIVISQYGPYGSGGPWVFVLLNFCFEDKTRLNKYLKDNGDSMDMTAYGYFQAADGTMFWDCMHRYTDLEYYRGDLVGKRRLLKPVSSLLKGEIDGLLAMQGYHIICREEKIKDDARSMNYTEEGFALAGIIKPEP